MINVFNFFNKVYDDLSDKNYNKDEDLVLVITGNGLKTQDPLINKIKKPDIINAKLEEFNEIKY